MATSTKHPRTFKVHTYVDYDAWRDEYGTDETDQEIDNVIEARIGEVVTDAFKHIPESVSLTGTGHV
jgi:Mg2+/Co2+ transporter CorC